jgi:hypothetical protein
MGHEQQGTVVPKWAKANVRLIMQALQINLLARFDPKEVLEAMDLVHGTLCVRHQEDADLEQYKEKWQNLRHSERWEVNQPEPVDKDTRTLWELEIIKKNIKLIHTSQTGLNKQFNNIKTQPILSETKAVTPERTFASRFDSTKSIHVVHMTPPPPQPVTRKEDRWVPVVPSNEDKERHKENFDRFTFTKHVNDVLKTFANVKQDLVESCHRLPSGDISTSYNSLSNGYKGYKG